MSWYDDILKGRGEYGQTGFSLGDALTGWNANNSQPLDPRLQQLGYRTNVSHQEGDVYSLVTPEGMDSQGTIMINGVPHIQVSRQASSLVKDPSQVSYNDKYGAVTPQANYELKDSPVDRAFSTAVRVGSVALPAMFMGGMIPGVEGVFGQGGLLGGGNAATNSNLVPGFVGAGEGDAAAVAAGLNSGGAGAAGGAGAGGGILSNLASGNIGAAGSGLLSWAASNPLQAAGALYSASGLLGGGDGGGGGGGGGNTQPAGLLSSDKFQRPAWTPNQHTLAQLQQLYGGRYGG